MTLLVRLIPLVMIIAFTYLLGTDLDKLENEKDERTKNWFGKILWFVFGWTFKLKKLGAVIRYLATFLIFWWLLNVTIVWMLR